MCCKSGFSRNRYSCVDGEKVWLGLILVCYAKLRPKSIRGLTTNIFNNPIAKNTRIGDRSIPEMGGRILRAGRMIGSFIAYRMPVSGFGVPGPTQLRMI